MLLLERRGCHHLRRSRTDSRAGLEPLDEGADAADVEWRAAAAAG